MGFGSNPLPAIRWNQIDLTGDKELLRMLADLPGKIQRKVLAKAMNAGASPIKAAIVRNAQAHRLTGLLAKSIIIKRKTYNRGSTFVLVIGPKSQRRAVRVTKKGAFRFIGKKKAGEMEAGGAKLRYINPAKYAHLLEGGHTGPRGSAPAYPFMRPAFEAHKRQAEGIITRYLWNGTIAEATKGKRKYRA